MAILLTVLSACSREQQDWRSAEATDTLDAYSQFLRHHPDSELATQARARLVQLTEDRDWQRAGAADTADAYRQFLAQHPNGKWAQEARIRVQNFALGEAPTPVAAGAAAVQAPMKPTAAARTGIEPSAAPTAMPVEAARPAAAASSPDLAAAVGSTSAPRAPAPPIAPARPANQQPAQPAALAQAARLPAGYAVQLGAFSSETAANSQWEQLEAHFGPQLQGLVPRIVAANTGSGRLYRLQAPVADEARARAVCEALKQRSQACVPVLP